jgi:hypothetical protein
LALGGDCRYHVALYYESERDQGNDGAKEVRGERRAIESLRKNRIPMLRRFFHEFTPVRGLDSTRQRGLDAAPSAFHRPPANAAEVASAGSSSRVER